MVLESDSGRALAQTILCSFSDARDEVVGETMFATGAAGTATVSIPSSAHRMTLRIERTGEVAWTISADVGTLPERLVWQIP